MCSPRVRVCPNKVATQRDEDQPDTVPLPLPSEDRPAQRSRPGAIVERGVSARRWGYAAAGLGGALLILWLRRRWGA